MSEQAIRHFDAGYRGLADDDIDLVEQNFAELMRVSDALTERFYQRLFVEHSSLTPLFSSVTIEGQEKKLLASMVLLVQHLRDTDMMVDYLQGLGVRHQQYGVMASHYDMFIENWLAVSAEFSGQAWNDSLENAWRNVLEYVSELMQTPAPHVAELTESYHTIAASHAEYALTSLAVAQTATPMIIIDRHLVIRYLNAAALSLLSEHQNQFKQAYPHTSPDSLVGSSLQQFSALIPFPLEWFDDVEQFPKSVDLTQLNLNLRLTISVLFQQDETAGFLLEGYPCDANQSALAPVVRSASFSHSPADRSLAFLSELEQALQDVQLQHNHLVAMLQEIDDAVFESSLLALNCSVEAAKLGHEARQFRDFSMEIRLLNQQLSQLLQPLKIQSGQAQMQTCLDLVQKLDKALREPSAGAELQSHQTMQQISQHLSQQTQALTQLIGYMMDRSSTS